MKQPNHETKISTNIIMHELLWLRVGLPVVCAGAAPNLQREGLQFRKATRHRRPLMYHQYLATTCIGLTSPTFLTFKGANRQSVESSDRS